MSELFLKELDLDDLGFSEILDQFRWLDGWIFRTWTFVLPLVRRLVFLDFLDFVLPLVRRLVFLSYLDLMTQK